MLSVKSDRISFAMRPSVELHLRPFQIADLGSPQPVPEGDQDQGSVRVTVAAVLGRLHEPLN